MRLLVLKMQMSLDGFMGKPDGDVSFIFTSFDDAPIRRQPCPG